MHVLAIYRVNEHLADLLAEASAERQAREARPKTSRFAFVSSRFGRGPIAAPGLTKAGASS